MTSDYETVYNAGVAAFVKTPSVSPVKTRLAKKLGLQCSLEFYELSLECIGTMLQELLDPPDRIQPYWAVAEPQSLLDPRWSSYPRISQGSGDLGERMSGVYQHLRARHDIASLIGSDSPQLSAATVRNAMTLLKESDFILGPALDGGFYLLAGRRDIPDSIFAEVPYSCRETGEIMHQALSSIGSVTLLECDFDIDEYQDLGRLGEYLRSQAELRLCDRRLLEWLKRVEEEG